MKEIKTLSPFKHLCMTIGNLPSSYVDSMSYYETLLWLCNYLKETVIPTVNNNAEAVEELQEAYIVLKNYVETYLENLDIQNEVNTKLDKMALDGTLTNLIKGYVDPFIAEQNAVITNNNTVQNNKINTLETRVNQIASGSPKVVDSLEAMTDHNQIYVLSTDGNWYYYNGTSFVSGGVYQAAVDSDTVNLLTKEIQSLSKNISLNKYKDTQILPYNWVDESSSNIREKWTPQMGLATVNVTANKYYLLCVDVIKNEADELTYGVYSINVRRTGTFNNISKTNIKSANIDISKMEVGKPSRMFVAFKSNESIGIYLDLFCQGVGTGSKKLDINFSTISLVEYDNEEDIVFPANNPQYATQFGYVIPNDVYGNDKTEELRKIIENSEIINYTSDLVFWGDSLTAGAGGQGTTFPAVCANTLNKTYSNMGIGGETGFSILARQGSITPVIPANVNCDSITLKDINGNAINTLIQGNVGVNPIRIDNSSTDYTLSRNSDGTYKITDGSGNVILTRNYPRFIKLNGSNTKGKITVFFIGTNGPSGETLVNMVKNAVKNTNGKYIVMGLTVGTTSSRNSLVNLYKNEFGNKFFDSGYLLSQYGLAINNLSPTSSDTQAMNMGSVPPTLMSDGVHLNNLGYNALGILLAHYIGSLY